MNREEVFALMSKDRFVERNGIRLVELGEGTATSEMVISDYHLNGNGTVQGGALFTLADFTCAAAANTHEKLTVSLDGSIDFIKAVSKGVLTAKATEVSVRRTIASYRVDITNEEGKLIATFHSKLFRLDPK